MYHSLTDAHDPIAACSSTVELQARLCDATFAGCDLLTNDSVRLLDSMCADLEVVNFENCDGLLLTPYINSVLARLSGEGD
jgi:hypothetical protein